MMNNLLPITKDPSVKLENCMPETSNCTTLVKVSSNISDTSKSIRFSNSSIKSCKDLSESLNPVVQLSRNSVNRSSASELSSLPHSGATEILEIVGNSWDRKSDEETADPKIMMNNMMNSTNEKLTSDDTNVKLNISQDTCVKLDICMYENSQRRKSSLKEISFDKTLSTRLSNSNDILQSSKCNPYVKLSRDLSDTYNSTRSSNLSVKSCKDLSAKLNPVVQLSRVLVNCDSVSKVVNPPHSESNDIFGAVSSSLENKIDKEMDVKDINQGSMHVSHDKKLEQFDESYNNILHSDNESMEIQLYSNVRIKESIKDTKLQKKPIRKHEDCDISPKKNKFSHSTPKIRSIIIINKEQDLLKKIKDISVIQKDHTSANVTEKESQYEPEDTQNCIIDRGQKNKTSGKTSTRTSTNKRMSEFQHTDSQTLPEHPPKRKKTNNYIKDIANLEDLDFEEEQHNSIEDPDYIPDSEDNVSQSHSKLKSMDSDNSHTNSKSQNSSKDFTGCTVDNRKLKVPTSDENGKIKNTKQNFCIYCKKLFARLDRHLERVHKQEKDVIILRSLPKNTRQKDKLFAKIRNAGNNIHNTDKKYNTGILIPCRRVKTKLKKAAEDYTVCSHCKGTYSKKTIRIHNVQCNPKYKKGAKNVLTAGRRLGDYIHELAGHTLRNEVFPILNDDDIVKQIKFDELIIIMGNKFCDKYTLKHQHDMIRSHLRRLGRLKIAVLEINDNLTQLSMLLQPQYYETFVQGVRNCAGYNSKNRLFKSPSLASSLGTLIKKCADQWIVECIKKGDLANFMGHSKDIHKEVYRVPIPVREIINVSQVLEAALEDKKSNEDEEKDNSDTQDTENVKEDYEICDEILCERSGSFNSLEEEEEKNSPSPKKRRSTSPYGKTIRRKWTEDERQVVENTFGDLKHLEKLPSLKQCQKCIADNKILHHRTPQQLKSWIDNQRKKDSRKISK